MGAGQAMKRIPLIKFPKRHPKPAGPLQHVSRRKGFLISPKELRCLKRRSKLSCWEAVSDLPPEACPESTTLKTN